MVDRADLTAIVLLLIAAPPAILFLTIFPNAIPQSFGFLEFLIITAPVYVYAAYWALDIRRALAVQTYRRQALGIALIVLVFWLAVGSSFFGPGVPFQIYAAVSEGIFLSVFVVLFYWIDASVLVFRRSDPLLRDTFRWSRIRIPIWIILISCWVAAYSFLGYAVGTNNVSLMNQALGTYSNPILFIIADVPQLIPIISGAILLPAIAIRSKWNKRLRSHFMWFAVFVILFPAILTPFPILPAVAILIMGLALYKSAKALVPLNKVSPAEYLEKPEPPIP
jgi:hypothetical protein